MNLRSVFSATAPMSMLLGGATMVVLAGVTLSPPAAETGAAPAVRLVSVTTPLQADGDNDSGFPTDDLFSADGSSNVERDQRSFSGRGFSERQEDKVREEKKESYFSGWFDGFGTGHDLGSSAPATSGDHDKDKNEKSEKKDDDLEDQFEDFQDDLKKIAKTQGGGDSSGGDSSNGKSSQGDDGESAEAGSGQGGISSLLAAIGQFITALLGVVQGSSQS